MKKINSRRYYPRATGCWENPGTDGSNGCLTIVEVRGDGRRMRITTTDYNRGCKQSVSFEDCEPADVEFVFAGRVWCDGEDVRKWGRF